MMIPLAAGAGYDAGVSKEEEEKLLLVLPCLHRYQSFAYCCLMESACDMRLLNTARRSKVGIAAKKSCDMRTMCLFPWYAHLSYSKMSQLI